MKYTVTIEDAELGEPIFLFKCDTLDVPRIAEKIIENAVTASYLEEAPKTVPASYIEAPKTAFAPGTIVTVDKP